MLLQETLNIYVDNVILFICYNNEIIFLFNNRFEQDMSNVSVSMFALNHFCELLFEHSFITSLILQKA